MERLKLWTYQTDDFDPSSGVRDISKSFDVKNVPGLQDAYTRLHAIIGTDQIIWCYTSELLKHEKAPGLSDRNEWVLEVPANRIKGIIDQTLWNRILGKNDFYTHNLLHKWGHEAIHLFHESESLRAKYISERKTEFDLRLPCDYWGSLFINDYKISGAEVLIPFPIDNSWVIEKIHHKCYTSLRTEGSLDARAQKSKRNTKL